MHPGCQSTTEATSSNWSGKDLPWWGQTSSPSTLTSIQQRPINEFLYQCMTFSLAPPSGQTSQRRTPDFILFFLVCNERFSLWALTSLLPQINSQDDNGVLVGNWSDDYSMGTPPTSWTGSVKILLQYANTGVPVCFAQCWVFAGVFNTCESVHCYHVIFLKCQGCQITSSMEGLTKRAISVSCGGSDRDWWSVRYTNMFHICAVLRCLGIPARVITNFSSAHDNTGNLKTDLIFKPDGTPDKRHTKDSIWLVQMPFRHVCWQETAGVETGLLGLGYQDFLYLPCRGVLWLWFKSERVLLMIDWGT